MSDNEDLKNFSIELTTEYLEKYPDNASRYCKKEIDQIKNIENAFNKKIAPNTPTTKPDELVSEILEFLFEYKIEDRKQIQNQYSNQKQVEMMVGELLERYIAKEGINFGWAFTAECIKAVDFIKKDGDDWIKLQIKASDNTENSSAKLVRDKTPIKHWFRRFSSPKKKIPKLKKNGELSKKGLTPEEYKKCLESKDYSAFTQPDYNWNNFPDEDLIKVLSEDGFRNFISEHIELIKN